MKGFFTGNQEYFKGFSVFLDDINVYMNSGIPENQYEYSEAEKNHIFYHSCYI